MSTLKELLKDRDLPVRVKHNNWASSQFFEVRYIHNNRAYGHDDNNDTWLELLSGDSWSLVEPPKPRLLAWRQVRGTKPGVVRIHPEGEFVGGSDWARVPHLDEPVRDEE